VTDYLGMQRRFWDAIWKATAEEIEKVLAEAWQDGFQHGREDYLDEELKEGTNEAAKG